MPKMILEMLIFESKAILAKSVISILGRGIDRQIFIKRKMKVCQSLSEINLG